MKPLGNRTAPPAHLMEPSLPSPESREPWPPRWVLFACLFAIFIGVTLMAVNSFQASTRAEATSDKLVSVSAQVRAACDRSEAVVIDNRDLCKMAKETLANPPQDASKPVAAPGLDGRDGKDGAPGPQGVPGQPGPKGDKGDPGVEGQGLPGAPGASVQGPAGKDGAPGKDGAVGPAGPAGAPGAAGPAGAAGEPPVSWTYKDTLGASHTCTRAADYTAAAPTYTCN